MSLFKNVTKKQVSKWTSHESVNGSSNQHSCTNVLAGGEMCSEYDYVNLALWIGKRDMIIPITCPLRLIILQKYKSVIIMW